jgi:glycosyltransferase involved in cell wall biosynthesis
MNNMNQPDLQKNPIYSRPKILLYKTIVFFKKNGLRQTIWRIWNKLGDMQSVKKKLTLYTPGTNSTTTLRKSRLKKVSFMIGSVEGPPKRYRVFNIAEGLQSRGIASCIFYENHYNRLEQVMDSDLVVIFRARMSPRVGTIIKKLDSAGLPVVFDIDDLAFEPRLIDTYDEARDMPDILKNGFVSDFNRYGQTLDMCRLATCTTETLAKVIRQKGKTCFVIPNTINRAQYDLATALLKAPKVREAGKLWIGYFSGTNTHNRDFLEASGAIVKILEKHANIMFHIVGPLQLPADFKQLGDRIVRKPLMSYLDMLKYLSKMDINLAPLEQNNIFTDCKSELKIFEAGLVEVPTIASRTASYSKCVSDGKNGFLAGNKEEWLQKLTVLVESKELRSKIGRQARKDFIDRFYIENVIDHIIDTYEKIVDI